MRIKFYKALWGMGGTFGEQVEKIEAAAYDGFEAPVPSSPSDYAGSGLDYVAMLFVTEVDELREGIAQALEAGAEVVNVHSGRDWWDFDTGARFFESALRAAEDAGIEIYHETHRGRCLFSPGATLWYLRRFPELRLTADFSHWTCVCESLLADQEDAVEAAIQATRHVHARVGHEEGPQVGDPRAPQWERYVAHFEGWWDRMKAAHEARGETVMRVDPEFGPPHYMPTVANGEPVADLWEVCLYMRDRLRVRWQS